MPGGVSWIIIKGCLWTVHNVTNASLGWVTERWDRWVRVSFLTTNDSIPSGCVTSVRHSARTGVSLMWHQPSGIITQTTWHGLLRYLLPVTCCGGSMVTNSPSLTAILISRNGYSISSRNMARMVSSIVASMLIGVYHQKSWNSSIHKTLHARRM